MITDRSSEITIGEQKYNLVLTTLATKQIAAKYGGLQNLGDKLLGTKDFELILSEIVWLVTLLANQGIMIHNMQNPTEKRPLLTTPFDLSSFKDSLMEAMTRGMKRNVLSEEKPGESSKNVQVE